MSVASLFVLGAIFGSFLNVLALRLNSGLSLSGRSHCSLCNRQLGVYELIPILSFFLLRFRCRGCHGRLSWQYPLVELWTALIFVTVFSPLADLWSNLLTLGVFVLYVAITVYDFRHKIIPDSLVYPSVLLAFLFRLLNGGTGLDWWAGPILALFFAAIWFFSKGRAMGFGDAKLALSMGFLLGAQAGLSAVVLSFWIGALVSLVFLGFVRINPLLKGAKKITIKSEIPFAPFLVLGAWLSAIFPIDLLHVSSF